MHKKVCVNFVIRPTRQVTYSQTKTKQEVMQDSCSASPRTLMSPLRWLDNWLRWFRRLIWSGSTSFKVAILRWCTAFYCSLFSRRFECLIWNDTTHVLLHYFQGYLDTSFDVIAPDLKWHFQGDAPAPATVYLRGHWHLLRYLLHLPRWKDTARI